MSDQAEYEGLYNGLVTAYEQGMCTILVKCDSELVINQMAGNYQVQWQLQNEYRKAQQQLGKFRVYKFVQISRRKNKVCDQLASRAVYELGRRYHS